MDVSRDIPDVSREIRERAAVAAEEFIAAERRRALFFYMAAIAVGAIGGFQRPATLAIGALWGLVVVGAITCPILLYRCGRLVRYVLSSPGTLTEMTTLSQPWPRDWRRDPAWRMRWVLVMWGGWLIAPIVVASMFVMGEALTRELREVELLLPLCVGLGTIWFLSTIIWQNRSRAQLLKRGYDSCALMRPLGRRWTWWFGWIGGADPAGDDASEPDEAGVEAADADVAGTQRE